MSGCRRASCQLANLSSILDTLAAGRPRQPGWLSSIFRFRRLGGFGRILRPIFNRWSQASQKTEGGSSQAARFSFLRF